MKYDPIKYSLGKVFNASPVLRILFYRLLDLLLLRTWHIKKELKVQSKRLKGDVSILDAGSGFGQYSYRMSKIFTNSRVLGVDVKAEQIKDCNGFFTKIGKNNVSFETADLTKFAKEENFDLILSVDVMEHIEEDVQVFKNFYASMKEGGVLIISTPSDQGGSDTHDHDHDHHDGDINGFIDEHVRDGYGIEDVTEKLTSAGFKNIEAKYTYGAPGHLSWLLSMKYPILILNASKALFIVLPIYYILTYPIAFVLNYFDLIGTHKTGTGLAVKAFK